MRGAATVLVDAEGTEVGTLLTLHDLSYQRALESRSRETERLRQLEILLAGLAHEIKNPLSGMRGAAQILATAPHADARARECTQIILTEIDRLNALMAQLLDLTGRLARAPTISHGSSIACSRSSARACIYICGASTRACRRCSATRVASPRSS